MQDRYFLQMLKQGGGVMTYCDVQGNKYNWFYERENSALIYVQKYFFAKLQK